MKKMKASNLIRQKWLPYLLKIAWGLGSLLMVTLLITDCAHYPVNSDLKQIDPNCGYRAKFMGVQGNSPNILFYLTFSGGGTRATSLSYGVLEELRKTEVVIDGKKRRLLDEVDVISSVSGGSFTAGYYGLFGERIFQDFESKVLKKNIQGALTSRTFLNPINWVRLSFATFDRSDLAAEYYDKYIFEGGTFGDIVARKGPLILINATDMITGTRATFIQELFDLICSDLSRFPVARAVAASSAVPVLLSPITLHNYAGTCGYKPPKITDDVLKEHDVSKRQFHLLDDIKPYLDVKKTPYIHLVDGGIADNLGLRAVLDRVHALGDFWTTLKRSKAENVHKVVFLVVNAETEVDHVWTLSDKPPPFSAMLQSYVSIAITRYNFETVMLLRESFNRWTDEVQKNRCGNSPIYTEPGACGDINFYLIEVKFDALSDETERSYFKRLPTSFSLKPEQVDKLREVAHRIMAESPEFQRLLKDLR